MKLIPLSGIAIFAGLLLNATFTVMPTTTEAIFGGQDTTDPLILNQDSGITFVSDSLAIDGNLEPLDTDLIDESAFGPNGDLANAAALSPFPGVHTEIAGQTGTKKAITVLYGGVSRANYLPKAPEFNQNCIWGVKVEEGVARFVGGAHAPNYAQDIAVPVGTPVVASCDGIVVLAQYSSYNGGYGENVIIDHGPFQTRYAHLSDVEVTVGQSVVRGQEIARSGNTGKSTGPHLHFEVIK